MGVSTEILIKSNKKEFRIVEIPIVVSYEGETSTHHPVSHGVSVIASTLKFISIEHPLKFYGMPGLVFLAIGLFFTIWTIQMLKQCMFWECVSEKRMIRKTQSFTGKKHWI